MHWEAASHGLLGSRNIGNSVSECSILEISRGAYTQTPPGSLRLRRSQGAERPVFSEICPLLCKPVKNPVPPFLARRKFQSNVCHLS